jgi:DNA gyrase/topoisomerase IV subunit A
MNLTDKLKRYKFKDAHGHPLNNCAEFIEIEKLLKTPDSLEEFCKEIGVCMASTNCYVQEIKLRKLKNKHKEQLQTLKADNERKIKGGYL